MGLEICFGPLGEKHKAEMCGTSYWVGLRKCAKGKTTKTQVRIHPREHGLFLEKGIPLSCSRSSPRHSLDISLTSSCLLPLFVNFFLSLSVPGFTLILFLSGSYQLSLHFIQKRRRASSQAKKNAAEPIFFVLPPFFPPPSTYITVLSRRAASFCLRALQHSPARVLPNHLPDIFYQASKSFVSPNLNQFVSSSPPSG